MTCTIVITAAILARPVTFDGLDLDVCRHPEVFAATIMRVYTLPMQGKRRCWRLPDPNEYTFAAIPPPQDLN